MSVDPPAPLDVVGQPRRHVAARHCTLAWLRYTWIHNPVPPFTVEQILGKTDADLVVAEEAAVLTAIKRHALEHGVPQRGTIAGFGLDADSSSCPGTSAVTGRRWRRSSSITNDPLSSPCAWKYRVSPERGGPMNR